MKKMNLIGILSLTLMLFFTAITIYAGETKRIAAIKEINGEVEVKIGKENWISAKTGTVLSQGDFIRTKANSSVLLDLDGTGKTASVQLKPNSQLKLSELSMNAQDDTQTTLLDLALGEILIKAQKLHSEKSKFEVKTPTSIVGVRGTTFSVTVEAAE